MFSLASFRKGEHPQLTSAAEFSDENAALYCLRQLEWAGWRLPPAGGWHTDTSLTITNFSSTAVGAYQVVVSNSGGSVTSTTATLASVDIKMFAGVIVDGPVGSNYLIQATSSLPAAWTPLTNVALPSQPYICIDYGSYTNGVRFYRAVPQ
jgi:hypothetical protein